MRTSFIVITLGTLLVSTTCGATAIIFGHEKIEIPQGVSIIGVTTYGGEYDPGDLVVDLKSTDPNPIAEMKTRIAMFQDIANQANDIAKKEHDKAVLLKGWEDDRNTMMGWGKAVIFAFVFLLFVVLPTVYIFKARVRASAQPIPHGEGREEGMRREVREFYWELDKFCRKTVFFFLCLSAFPALFVVFIVIQHPTFVDIAKSDSPIWPMVTSVVAPFLFFVTVAASIHERLSKFINPTGT